MILFKPDEFHPGLGKHLQGKGVVVSLFKVHLFNPGVNDHLGADGTGLGGAVQRGTGNWYPVEGSLDDHILFSMNTPAKLMFFPGGYITLIAQATGLYAMGDLGGRPVITRA